MASELELQEADDCIDRLNAEVRDLRRQRDELVAALETCLRGIERPREFIAANHLALVIRDALARAKDERRG